MADWGIKVTEKGKDITSTDIEDYTLWSKYPFIKTYIVGTYEYTFPSDLTEVDISITHNLGYRPLFFVTIDGSNQDVSWITNGWWADWYVNGGDKCFRWWSGHAWDDGTCRIRYKEGTTYGSGYNPTGEVWTFKYYIFIETATG